MKNPLSSLRFRTRLALVMFLTMASTSGALMLTYVHQNQQIKVYVLGITQDLLAVSQLTQQTIDPKADRQQAFNAYLQALKKVPGLSNVTIASPSGEVQASTTPGQIGKKIKIRKKQHVDPNKDPIKISAEFQDVNIDSGVGERTYLVEFPLVQGDKVIGYAQVRGIGDEISELLRRTYFVRLSWLLATMLAGMFSVVFLAFRFTKPINTLVTGARQVAQGNLYVTLPTGGGDEMGVLAGTFNEMVVRLRENRQLQERLNEAEKTSLLGRFAATVAHEVRNSLNFINLSIDQIRAKHTGGDERAERELRRNLANVKDEIARLNHLVNSFLSAGRQAPPAFARCNVGETVEQAIAMVEKQARRQGITISTDLPENCPLLRADAAQLKTCFLNILTNAVQAMPQGGEIRIAGRIRTADGEPGRLELRFSDTGPGIPVADRGRVFAPFYSTKATGFGLGLAITKKVVEDHGGSIHVTAGDGAPSARPVPAGDRDGLGQTVSGSDPSADGLTAQSPSKGGQSGTVIVVELPIPVVVTAEAPSPSQVTVPTG
ncbi:MAG: hypothetical protein DMG21_13435 [Acidobacteria bacterium]|nr:MAG: hypothetical protein DMG21_13435 [Acidobacteriota bacterium]